LFCSFANANSDPLTDVVSVGGGAAGDSIRKQHSPYRGAQSGYDNQLIYLYEGERVYVRAYRVGLKFEQDLWRVDAFLQQRLEGWSQDRAPDSVAGMALREPGIDAGLAVRRRTAWGTPYAELSHDVSERSRGTELKLGYWNDWVRGRFALRPHLAVALRDSKLNDFYYGVPAAEATAQRPAYSPGGGADAEIGLYGFYRLTDNWRLFGGVTALRRASGVYGSPIVDDRLETMASVGLYYDWSPQIKRWAPESRPLIGRALYGYSSDCDLAQIVRLDCTSTHTKDHTDIWGVDVGRMLFQRPGDWPMDLAGFVGVIQHREKGFQDDFLQIHAYFKAYFYGFPWDRAVRTRLGFGAGLSYVTRIPEMEVRDQARRNRGTWKLLNYLDPTVDFRLGDLIPARSLRDAYLGVGVSHRSGMFGKSRLFGDVAGGSNYIYLYLENTF